MSKQLTQTITKEKSTKCLPISAEAKQKTNITEKDIDQLAKESQFDQLKVFEELKKLKSIIYEVCRDNASCISSTQVLKVTQHYRSNNFNLPFEFKQDVLDMPALLSKLKPERQVDMKPELNPLNMSEIKSG